MADHELPTAVDVLVDQAPARLGALSYLVPPGVTALPGDAVTVPFGKRTAHGVVLGPGDTTKATRELTTVWGRRIDPRDMAVAAALADRHLSSLAVLAPRFAPRDGKGVPPVALPDPTVTDEPVTIGIDAVADRYLFRAPFIDATELAATAAWRLWDEAGRDGQVLVLCPTKAVVKAVVSRFGAGAASFEDPGVWAGFVAGTVPIAVGTRSAAWYSPTKLAGIVIVEDDHPGHVEARLPHTHARDVAVARARALGVPVVISASCPTAAGLGAKIKLAIVGSRSDMPSIELMPAAGRAVPTRAQARIARSLRQGQSVLVVTATSASRLICANCRAPRPDGDQPCPRCSETATVSVGWDPARVTGLFADKITAVGPGQVPKSRYDLVVVLAADAGLRRPGLEPSATVARTLTRAASWCRSDGKLLAVVEDPDQPILEALAAPRLREVAKLIWADAKAAKLPPFGRLVTVEVARPRSPSTATWPGQVLGPRQVSPGQWEILVRCEDDELPALGAAVGRLRRSAKVRLTVA